MLKQDFEVCFMVPVCWNNHQSENSSETWMLILHRILQSTLNYLTSSEKIIRWLTTVVNL